MRNRGRLRHGEAGHSRALAYDYLMKPFGLEQVEALLLRLNERQGLVQRAQLPHLLPICNGRPAGRSARCSRGLPRAATPNLSFPKGQIEQYFARHE